MSATAIYHYFANKDALVSRVVGQGFRRFGDYLQAAADQQPAGSFERVRALGEAYLRFALEHQAHFRVLFSIQHGNAHRLEELPEGGGYGLLRRAVVDAIAAGNMRPDDPDMLVMYLWSVAHGLLTISLACRIERCPEFGAESVALGPVELFQGFESFVRDGLAARAGRGGNE